MGVYGWRMDWVVWHLMRLSPTHFCSQILCALIFCDIACAVTYDCVSSCMVCAS